MAEPMAFLGLVCTFYPAPPRSLQRTGSLTAVCGAVLTQLMPNSVPSTGPHGTALEPAAPPVQPVQLCLQEQEGPAATHANPHQ